MEDYNQENAACVFGKMSVVELWKVTLWYDTHQQLHTHTNTLTQLIISQDCNLNEDLCFIFKTLLKISFPYFRISVDIVKRECVF